MHVSYSATNYSSDSFQFRPFFFFFHVVFEAIIAETVTTILNPSVEEEGEQTIYYSRNIDSSERVSVVVICVREFPGKPEELNSWRKSADRILLM